MSKYILLAVGVLSHLHKFHLFLCQKCLAFGLHESQCRKHPISYETGETMSKLHEVNLITVTMQSTHLAGGVFCTSINVGTFKVVVTYISNVFEHAPCV